MFRFSAGFSIAVCTTLVLLITAGFSPAFARSYSHGSNHKVVIHSSDINKGLHGHGRFARHMRPEPPRDAAIVVDGSSGKVLYARNATAQRYPASLTKMMTLYLLFEQLKQGKITMDSPITASAHAVSQHPTKLGLSVGESINVDLAIKAIVVRSANDVAVAIAETLGGTEDAFAALMTRKAHQLGMTQTEFHNASGLPNPEQTTTARDLAVLGRHVAYDFPQYYHYFATPDFTYQSRVFVTHDNLLGRFEGVDGIKTGYTNASGFNLVSSVVREGKHIIGVVMGGRTARSRDNEMMELLAATLERARLSPTLVAQAHVPWQGGSQAGAMVATNEDDVTKSLNLHINGFEDTSTPLPATDDEDAAESMTANGAAPAAATNPPAAGTAPGAAPAPAGAVVASATKPVTTVALTGPQSAAISPAAPLPAQALPSQQSTLVWTGPMPKQQTADLGFMPPTPKQKPQLAKLFAVVPTPKPQQQRQQPMVLASLGPNLALPVPALRPTSQPPAAQQKIASLPQPAPESETEEGDIGGTVLTKPTLPRPAEAAGIKAWAVQIGAFADEKMAKTQLALYAERSMDVLRHASRTITPFDSVDGHKLFRARFGPFAENEAREVCRRMTERGQTCFAAVISN